jgi:uncharacterized protein YkwD
VSLSSYYLDEMSPPTRRQPWLARLAAVAAMIVAVALVGTMAAVSAGRPRPPVAPAAYPTVEPPLPAPTGSSEAPDGRPPGAGAPIAGTPSPVPPQTNPPDQPQPPPSGLTPAEAAVFAIVNQERAKAHCNPLTVDSRLTTAARRHSADMAARGYFDHATPDGVSFATRITNAGYRWSTAGENIAKGQPTAASVMKAWMNSPGHRANILNCSYRNIGIGLAYSPRREPVWTQDFAAPMR